MIAPFRTPFWLEYKRWYVKFQYAKDNENSQIIVQSSMNANDDFLTNQDHHQISYFTYTTKDDDRSQMSSIWSARFSYTWIMMHTSSWLKQSNYYMCPKWTRLVLDVDDYIEWPANSFDFLPTLVDLSPLNEIWLLITWREGFDSKIINNLLEKAFNVRTFGITYDSDFEYIIERVCSVLSRQIEHLKIQLNYIRYMKLMLERAEHLSTVTLIHDWRLLRHQKEMIEWLNDKQKEFSIAKDHQSIQVWFNKNIIETEKSQMLSS